MPRAGKLLYNLFCDESSQTSLSGSASTHSQRLNRSLQAYADTIAAAYRKQLEFCSMQGMVLQLEKEDNLGPSTLLLALAARKHRLRGLLSCANQNLNSKYDSLAVRLGIQYQ